MTSVSKFLLKKICWQVGPSPTIVWGGRTELIKLPLARRPSPPPPSVALSPPGRPIGAARHRKVGGDSFGAYSSGQNRGVKSSKCIISQWLPASLHFLSQNVWGTKGSDGGVDKSMLLLVSTFISLRRSTQHWACSASQEWTICCNLHRVKKAQFNKLTFKNNWKLFFFKMQRKYTKKTSWDPHPHHPHHR